MGSKRDAIPPYNFFGEHWNLAPLITLCHQQPSAAEIQNLICTAFQRSDLTTLKSCDHSNLAPLMTPTHQQPSAAEIQTLNLHSLQKIRFN